jgi:hypothetical protein
MPNSDGCEVEENIGTLPIEDWLAVLSKKACVLGFWYSYVNMDENSCDKGGLVSGARGIIGNGIGGAFITIDEISLICEFTVKVEVGC